jgi:hypothetical protein
MTPDLHPTTQAALAPVAVPGRAGVPRPRAPLS